MTIQYLHVLENVSDLLDRNSAKKIRAVYADKGCDARPIGNYLKKRNITYISQEEILRKIRTSSTTNQTKSMTTRRGL